MFTRIDLYIDVRWSDVETDRLTLFEVNVHKSRIEWQDKRIEIPSGDVGKINLANRPGLNRLVKLLIEYRLGDNGCWPDFENIYQKLYYKPREANLAIRLLFGAPPDDAHARSYACQIFCEAPERKQFSGRIDDLVLPRQNISIWLREAEESTWQSMDTKNESKLRIILSQLGNDGRLPRKRPSRLQSADTARATPMAAPLRPVDPESREYVSDRPAMQNARAVDQYWRLPLQENSFFVGRKHDLERLDELAHPGKMVSIVSLGGIGKTQLANHFARQSGLRYSEVHWVTASNVNKLASDFRDIVSDDQRLSPEHLAGTALVKAVREYLATTPDWLIVVDNLDEPSLLLPYLPSRMAGCVIATSRSNEFQTFANCTVLPLDVFSAQESLDFLQLRTKPCPDDSTEFRAMLELSGKSGLDGLALALEQAAAYVSTVGISFVDYLAEYKAKGISFLAKAKPGTGNYERTVSTTWWLNYEEVCRRSRPAADLLSLTATMNNPYPIPFAYVCQGMDQVMLYYPSLAAHMAAYVSKQVALLEVLSELARFSLVTVQANQERYTMHTVVQEVIRGYLSGIECP